MGMTLDTVMVSMAKAAILEQTALVRGLHLSRLSRDLLQTILSDYLNRQYSECVIADMETDIAGLLEVLGRGIGVNCVRVEMTLGLRQRAAEWRVDSIQAQVVSAQKGSNPMVAVTTSVYRMVTN